MRKFIFCFFLVFVCLLSCPFFVLAGVSYDNTWPTWGRPTDYQGLFIAVGLGNGQNWVFLVPESQRDNFYFLSTVQGDFSGFVPGYINDVTFPAYLSGSNTRYDMLFDYSQDRWEYRVNGSGNQYTNLGNMTALVSTNVMIKDNIRVNDLNRNTNVQNLPFVYSFLQVSLIICVVIQLVIFILCIKKEIFT